MPEVRVKRLPRSGTTLREEQVMVIDLDDQQRTALTELVDRRLVDLPVEIRHTDNRGLRQVLRDERELLLSVVRVLSPPSAQASGQ